MSKSHYKKLFWIAVVVFAIIFGIKSIAFFNNRRIGFDDTSKIIKLNDNGLNYQLSTNTNSVDDFLKEKNVSLNDRDQIIPEKNEKLFPGTNIAIRRASKIKIKVDGKTQENYTLENTVENALRDSNVTLGRLDKTDPDKNFPVQNGMIIAVTRINVEEVTKQEDIDFKTTQKLDSKMGWREKSVTTPGEKGIREVNYKITYKDGKEISRVVLSKSVVKEPVTQVETQGTYVKTGKAAKGQGTWYSYQGGMYAASLSIARGGYAKVTNTANGKSVIVQINDAGPYGKGRIIDLDKPAFEKIASLGAGVIGVKVEEVLN
ncbi:MAG: G5 domain-containing protein [Parcubacteria group bacterium]|jgi:uncharacterized protein YabE (DUF348 family)